MSRLAGHAGEALTLLCQRWLLTHAWSCSPSHGSNQSRPACRHSPCCQSWRGQLTSAAHWRPSGLPAAQEGASTLQGCSPSAVKVCNASRRDRKTHMPESYIYARKHRTSDKIDQQGGRSARAGHPMSASAPFQLQCPLSTGPQSPAQKYRTL